MKLKLINVIEDNFKKGLLGTLTEPPLTHMFLAGMIPKDLDIDVEIIDEQIDSIDFDMDCDVVAFSVTTHGARRCYEYAKKFKKRNKVVIMGGYHVTLCPDEAQKHADSIVVGEAEIEWPRLLRDLVKKRLKKRYVSNGPVDLNLTPIPRRDLINLDNYRMPNVVITTRGCPYMCTYCASSKIFGKFRRRKVSDVLKEMKYLKNNDYKEKLFIFADDELFFPKNKALEFFSKLEKLNIKWVSQATMTALYDKDLMKVAARAGCRGLIVGIESFNKRTHKYLKKYQNLRKDIDSVLEYVNNLGIVVGALIILGLDTDTPKTIKDTMSVLKESRFGLVQVGVLRAYPNTSIYNNLLSKGRVRKNWWLNDVQYEDAFNDIVPDHLKVYYKPKYFTPGELQIKALELIIKSNSIFSYRKIKNLLKLLYKGNKILILKIVLANLFMNLKLKTTLKKLKKLKSQQSKL